ncbi:MAG: GNAT family N-acetyltransferase [Oscillospiraceae bacterium]
MPIKGEKIMADMLVKLYNFECDNNLFKSLEEKGITVRRAIGPEKNRAVEFAKTFHDCWGSECDVAFAKFPPTCFIAIKDMKIVGFSCIETTSKDFFGPTGVAEEMRGLHLGKALLHIALQDLKNRGYAYAIIGDAGPTGFYEKFCGATSIPDSEPGVYKNLIV